MFTDKLSKLLDGVFHRSPKYITVTAVRPALGAGQAPELPPKEALPKHVAIIMDGNGRWAVNRGLPRSAGHAAGTEALRDIIRSSSDWGIQCLTIYAFSTENWARDKEEVNALMGLLLKYFASEIDELHEKNVRITILGDADGFPQAQRDAMVSAMERTKENTGLRLNIALNYGGRAEIVDAVNRIIAEPAEHPRREITEESFRNYLYAPDIPDPDLLIRTSGELRLSNFLLWELSYAELYVTDTLWPDFGKEEFKAAIAAFQHRDRRFGGRK